METKQELSGYYQLYTVCMYVCVRVCVSFSLFIFCELFGSLIGKKKKCVFCYYSSVCNTLGVSIVRYVTVSNIDKPAVKLYYANDDGDYVNLTLPGQHDDPVLT